MPMTFDLPRNNRRELGLVLERSITAAKWGDAVAAYTMATAVREYLMGNRNFRIYDPFNPNYTLMEVSIPRDQPGYEAIVSDVAQETGRQQRMDVTPNTAPIDLTMQAARDAAVAKGMLSYLCTDFVTDPAHRLFQKYRVEDGFAGLAVTPTVYPGRGWGVKFHTIPLEELIYLPVGCRGRGQSEGVVWRKWVTLKWLKRAMAQYATITGRAIRFPAPGSEMYDKMRVVKVPAGMTLRQTLMGYDSASVLEVGSRSFYASDSESPTLFDTEFVEFSQTYMYDAPQQRYMQAAIKMAGAYVLDQEWFEEGSEKLMPLRGAPYADVGGIYGRSYAWCKMMMNINQERFFANLSRNASDLDAYGFLAMSAGMDVQGDMITKVGEGYRVFKYNTDAGATDKQPFQIKPISLQQTYGTLPQQFMQAGDRIFPSSDLFSGNAPGRVDSDIALHRLEVLSNTQIAAGAREAAAAWGQCYAAALEMASRHYQEGDAIPLVYIDDSMAGVVLDTATLPLSEEEQQVVDQQREQRARYFYDKGVDPMLGEMLAKNQLSGDIPPVDDAIEKRQVPVARFTIGPNVIPHPDRVNIGIQSLMPRDRDAEYGEMLQALQLGMVGLDDIQIESRIVNLNKFVGGKAIWYTYKTAVLNLLSAFGNGQESGPIIIPQPFTFVPQIGYKVVSTFVCSDVFHLSSDTCKRKILSLLEFYNPVNTPGTTLTADEAAAQHNQLIMARNKGAGRGGMLPPPQPQQQLMGRQ